MAPLDLGFALRAASGADPGAIPDVILRVASEAGATDVVLYLVDFAQTTLEPVPDRGTHADLPQSEQVGTTMAGRAFVDRAPVVAERPDGARIWVPVIEGSDRVGVLAVTVAQASDAVIGACEDLGLLAGYLIAAQARATDLYNLYRRRRALSLAASMQWDLLPPLMLKTDRMTVAGIIEPAYDVGGDCFDYALNDTVFNLAIVDPMGHGMTSSLIASLTLGNYRHDRREGRTLAHMHTAIDTAMTSHFTQLAFATGQLARIDLDSGELSWTNAGHPPPMLIRSGRVIGELDCPPTLPWGLGGIAKAAKSPTVATEALEPGDSVLFYTDGVTEAHVPGGEQFGVERLIDLVGQHASDQLEPEQMIRQIVAAVLDHQSDDLADDATLVIFNWAGPDA